MGNIIKKSPGEIERLSMELVDNAKQADTQVNFHETLYKGLMQNPHMKGSISALQDTIDKAKAASTALVEEITNLADIMKQAANLSTITEEDFGNSFRNVASDDWASADDIFSADWTEPTRNSSPTEG